MSRTKTLAGRTFALVFVLSVTVMLASVILATAASFQSYEKEAEQYLLSQVSALKESFEGQDDVVTALEHHALVGVRCTLVDADGTVLYDSDVPPEELDNHASREEIVAARQSGHGATLRKSQTLGTDTLYAAVPLEGGKVLRLSETRTSLASFLSGMSMQLAFSVFAIFVLSLVFSRLITRMVAKPLEDIDLSYPLENNAYEEIKPLLVRVDQQTRELQAQNEELKRAMDIRRRFTSNVSHEMKSPLQVIGGYAELIESGMVEQEDIPRFAGLIRSESEAMRSLIDDIMTLSKLDEGLDSEPCEVDVGEACLRVAARLEPKARAKSVSVPVDTEESCVVNASVGLVEQMLYNLIDNAIKFSPEGGAVSVTASLVGASVIIKVADNGPGIPDEYKERIFERFFRVDESRARETGGTGLGLAIVKHVARTYGGEVYVEDNAPSGSVFIVELPASRCRS